MMVERCSFVIGKDGQTLPLDQAGRQTAHEYKRLETIRNTKIGLPKGDKKLVKGKTIKAFQKARSERVSVKRNAADATSG